VLLDALRSRTLAAQVSMDGLDGWSRCNAFQFAAEKLLHRFALQRGARSQFIPCFFGNVSNRQLDTHAFIVMALPAL